MPLHGGGLVTESYQQQNTDGKVPSPLERMGMLTEANRRFNLTLAEARLYALFLERCGPKYGGELKIGNEELAAAIDMDIHSVIAGLKGLREKRLLFSRRNKHGPSTHSPFHDFQDGSPSAHDPHFQDGSESAGFATPPPSIEDKGTSKGKQQSPIEARDACRPLGEGYTQLEKITAKQVRLVETVLLENGLTWSWVQEQSEIPGLVEGPPAELADLPRAAAGTFIAWLKKQKPDQPDDTEPRGDDVFSRQLTYKEIVNAMAACGGDGIHGWRKVDSAAEKYLKDPDAFWVQLADWQNNIDHERHRVKYRLGSAFSVCQNQNCPPSGPWCPLHARELVFLAWLELVDKGFEYDGMRAIRFYQDNPALLKADMEKGGWTLDGVWGLPPRDVGEVEAGGRVESDAKPSGWGDFDAARISRDRRAERIRKRQGSELPDERVESEVERLTRERVQRDLQAGERVESDAERITRERIDRLPDLPEEVVKADEGERVEEAKANAEQIQRIEGKLAEYSLTWDALAETHGDTKITDLTRSEADFVIAELEKPVMRTDWRAQAHETLQEKKRRELV